MDGDRCPTISVGRTSVVNSTNFALPVGSIRLTKSPSGNPTQGMTIDQASTQRSRYTRSSSGNHFRMSSMP